MLILGAGSSGKESSSAVSRAKSISEVGLEETETVLAGADFRRDGPEEDLGLEFDRMRGGLKAGGLRLGAGFERSIGRRITVFLV